MVGPSELVAVIMAGGAGTRFWPASTADRPKQFLALLGERTLLQMSFDRLSGLVASERILVLTADRFMPLVREQLPELPAANIIGEPMRRDTAAAVTLGALLARRRYGDVTMVTVTADHLIEPVAVFHDDVVSAARGAASSGALYTFGIAPTHAATGYGYLEIGAVVGEVDDGGAVHCEVRRFVEKPAAATALRYLASGRFLWNSGMFVWSTEAILDAVGRCLPGHLAALEPALERDQSAAWPAALRVAFTSLETVSVDHGVMERAAEVRCLRARFAWSDVGGWEAVAERLPVDAAGNRCRGRVHADDARTNLVFTEDPEETVILLGVSGLAVVRSGPRTLVVPRERAEEIKALVAQLGEP